jgi:RimJ/RimL family protein N-acetyltransferase
MILETPRLRLGHLVAEDASFVLALVLDPDWLRYIGDRGIRDLDGARAFVEDGPRASYREHGFGLYRVERREDGVAIGLCGLLRRAGLDDPDLGFALLPAYRGRGYAREAAAATLDHARRDLGLSRVAAITRPDNASSITLLETLGFRHDGQVVLPGEDVRLRRYLRDLP